VYSDPEVARFVSDRFVPVRVHVKDSAAEFQRLSALFDAQWTPTTLVVDGTSKERHRIEGFLPKDDFASQLELGLAKSAFGRGAFGEAEHAFEDVLRKHPDTDAAPEAQYWAGVSRYKVSGDPKALQDVTKRFKERYADSTWAKKASVWGKD
jgi:TolA-binding protein